MMDTYMNYTNSVKDDGKLTHNGWAVVTVWNNASVLKWIEAAMQRTLKVSYAAKLRETLQKGTCKMV